VKLHPTERFPNSHRVVITPTEQDFITLLITVYRVTRVGPHSPGSATTFSPHATQGLSGLCWL